MTRKHFLVLVIAYGAACVGLLREVSVNAQTREEAPVRQIKLIVGPSIRQEFFDGLASFASQASFEFRVEPTRPGGEYFLVSMWRADMDIVGLNPLNPTVFNVYFYVHSPRTLTEAQIDALAAQLKESVVVPGGARLAP